LVSVHLPRCGFRAGTPNDNLTLFNFQGTALPSIGIFRSPAAVCESYDPYGVPCVLGS
jgi:arabinogalactan endo-1,4-beta-galactosidase